MAAAIRSLAIILTLYAALAQGKPGYGPGEQDWGYIDVRPGAHMFYWLYYTTANVTNYVERPLAIWLQGGPGASSIRYGNFDEFGPVDLYGNYRNWTWVKDMNVLFIDNPVGAGYSYVDNNAYLTATNQEIASDLVELMKGFYAKHPEFETVPLHIFSESYGGKMAPEFALELYYAIQRKEIKSNLTSVSLGDPWTSPIDSVLSWAPFLLQLGIIDHDGHDQIMKAANFTAELVENERWAQATTQWGNTQWEVLKASKGVDFYNVLKLTRGDAYQRRSLYPAADRMYRTLVKLDFDEDIDQIAEDLLRGPVAETLGIPDHVKWDSQSGAVFDIHRTDFMKPVIHIVNELLDKTPLQVAVFSGGLDLICSTPGTVNWIDKLNWTRRNEYLAAPRTGINVDRVLEGYEKTGGNFTMFWINRSGHMAPADNPAGMSHVLRSLTNFG
ncbi:retinoid-inducible serine carboxypeptidase [Drosophila sulfurigaster albostrigata]|uniref:retinoid-inducible serine carboxypeptidase n=1 Tax=Drosophila sulfurigaster albostrigata TaxID=89887 RepID=UPI002D21EB83|nr:retinoid-inducible serine carboxypeptidase [Drosophila sulfurigaster albostrigata]